MKKERIKIYVAGECDYFNWFKEHVKQLIEGDKDGADKLECILGNVPPDKNDLRYKTCDIVVYDDCYNIKKPEIAKNFEGKGGLIVPLGTDTEQIHRICDHITEKDWEKHGMGERIVRMYKNYTKARLYDAIKTVRRYNGK